MYGPAFRRTAENHAIEPGCWFEEEFSPRLVDRIEFVLGFSSVTAGRIPSGLDKYLVLEDPQPADDDSWIRVHPGNNGSADQFLFDPFSGSVPGSLARLASAGFTVCDAREAEKEELPAIHTLPVNCWLQRNGTESIVPPYYENTYRPRGSDGYEPFFTLIHGYTGGPENWDYFIEKLEDYGYCAPLLPGHRLPPDRFGEFGTDDWSNAVEFWTGRIGDRYETSVGVGLSMGGALAVEHWQSFDALVLINTPLRVPDWKRYLFPVAHWFKTYHEFQDVDKVIPVHTLNDLRDILSRCRNVLEKVEVPVLVINHGDDETVSPNHGRAITSMLPEAEHLFLEDGIHESPTEPEVAVTLFEKITGWLSKKGLLSQ